MEFDISRILLHLNHISWEKLPTINESIYQYLRLDFDYLRLDGVFMLYSLIKVTFCRIVFEDFFFLALALVVVS